MCDLIYDSFFKISMCTKETTRFENLNTPSHPSTFQTNVSLNVVPLDYLKNLISVTRSMEIVDIFSRFAFIFWNYIVNSRGI